VADRLAQRTGRGASGPDVQRDARVVAFVLFLEVAASDLARVVADGPTVVYHPAVLGERSGLGRAAVERAVDALLGTGVLHWSVAHPETHFTFDRSVIVAAPNAHGVVWRSIQATLSGEAAALLTFRTLLDVGAPLTRWVDVRHDDLLRTTTYSQNTLRRAMRRLVDRGLLEREDVRGGASRYRFGPVAFGSAASIDPAPPSPAEPLDPRAVRLGAQPASPASPATPDLESTARAPAPSAMTPPSNAMVVTGVTLTVGGVTVAVAAGVSLELGAGCRATVRIGPDGRTLLDITPSGPPASGG
jgi:hypothetical protein